MSTAKRRESQADDTLNLMADLPLVFMAVGVIVLMLGIFAQRIPHPYDLEWMEGGMLLHGYRVQEGLGLYVIPSSDFIPFIYPPLYSWVLGLGGELFGLSYGLGRGISVLGTLMGAAALVAAVRGERGSGAMGLGAAALFLTTWDDSGTFMDLVRTDGLLIGLMGWALVAMRHGWIRTGGALLVLAFMAKQNVAVFGLPGLLWIGYRWGWRGALRFLCWCLLPALVFVGLMTFEGDGLFLTYLLEVPATHPFVFPRFWPGTPVELYESLPWTTISVGVVILVGPILFLISKIASSPGIEETQHPGWCRSFPREMGPGLYWASQAALVILMCMVMRGHHGGYLNVLMPGHWMLAGLAGMSLGALQRWIPSVGLRVVVTVLVCTQLWQGTQWKKNGKVPVDDPPIEAWLPTEGDVLAGDWVVAEMSEVEGPVLAPWYPWMPVKAGKRPYFHLIALWDIMHKGSPLRTHGESVSQDLRQKRWKVIYGIHPGKPLKYGMEKNYQRAGSLRIPREAGSLALKTRTGWPVRPQTTYEPKKKRKKKKKSETQD